MAAQNYKSGHLLWRLLMVARPYWTHLFLIVMLSFLATPLALLMPIPLKIVVDHVLGTVPIPEEIRQWLPASWSDTPGDLLWVAVGGAIAVATLSAIQWSGTWLLQTYTGEKLALRLRAHLYRHLQRLAFGYHDQKGSADATYRIQYDAAAIRHILVDSIIPFLTALFPIIGISTALILLDWQLAAIVIAACPILAFLVRAFGGRLREQWKSVKDKDSAAMSLLQEALSSLRFVKAYSREGREEERFNLASDRRIRDTLRATRTHSYFEILTAATLSIATASILFLGVRHVQEGILTLGQLLMVMAYTSQIFGPIQTMTKTSTGLANSLASAERVFSVMDQTPDVDDAPDALPLHRARGAIRFQNVSFSYGPNQSVLENLNLEIPAGMTVGIQGRTGSGKSTLMSLLMRFYDPTSGAILLDGQDLRRYKLQDLRRQIAIVMQDPVLFSTSILENIEYGRPGASREDIEEAAKQANAHEFIGQLPDGYDTVVGERGVTLSGGERQRIALARAFLRNAPILILDEPTSAVDTKTEASIITAVNRLMEGRTTFMIAHRLSTLDKCQMRIELRDGNLQEISAEPAHMTRSA